MFSMKWSTLSVKPNSSIDLNQIVVPEVIDTNVFLEAFKVYQNISTSRISCLPS